MNPAKTSDGPNDRAREAPIGQSAGGLPDDGSHPVEIDDAKAARIEAALLGGAEGEGEDESEAHPS